MLFFLKHHSIGGTAVHPYTYVLVDFRRIGNDVKLGRRLRWSGSR